MSLLRQAMGLARRHNVALESEEDSMAAMTSDASDVVVMKGSLSDNYATALNQLYAKDQTTDPTAAPEPTAETGTNVDKDTIVPQPGEVIEPEEATNIPEVTNMVLESQAQDAVLMQTLHDALTPEDPPTEEYMTLYGVGELDVEPEDIVEVTKLLQETDQPENITVMIDDAIPADPDLSPEECAESEQLATSLEGIVLAMGGKVVHNFKEFAQHYKARIEQKKAKA